MLSLIIKAFIVDAKHNVMQYNYDWEMNKCSLNPAASHLIINNDGYFSKAKLLQSNKCSSKYF